MLVDIHTETERGDVLTTRERLVVGFEDKLLIVPEGFESDGASVPRLFWRIVCPPTDPHAVRAGVAHDYIYRTHPKALPGTLAWYGILHDAAYCSVPPEVIAAEAEAPRWTRKDADDLFYSMLVADGTPRWRALLAYWGVRIGGGRAWKQGGKQ